MAHRLLITGGAGFIGSALVRALLAPRPAAELEVERVIVLDALSYAGNRANLDGVDDARLCFVHGRMGDTERVAELLRRESVTGVFNLAAETHVDRSIDAPCLFYEVNLLETEQFARCCHAHFAETQCSEHTPRFLHVSTDEVYGSLHPEDAAFTEAAVLAPNSPYAASKAAADLMLRAMGRTFGFPHVIVHGCNNFGPRQFPEKLIPLVVLRAIAGQPLPVYGKGDQVREWIHVADFADALIVAFARGEKGQRYNIGGGTAVTNLDLVQRICSLLDAERPRQEGSPHADLIRFVSDRPGHDQRYALDGRRFADLSGWKPSRSFGDALAETVRWYMENTGWCEHVLKNQYDLRRLGRLEARQKDNGGVS